MGVKNDSFIKACWGKNDGRIPIWIMRQAGRYLPEYRAVRERVSFLELCKTPELIAEVVRQPIARFDLDAAILFSDILTLLEPMGVGVAFPEGGPRVEFALTKPDDVKRLKDFDVSKEFTFVSDGIRLIKKTLPNSPVIGFSGSPFTLACYLIEGKGSKTFDKAKQFIQRYPSAAEELIDFLSDVIARYLKMQIEAGADAVQLFSSWDGILSFEDFSQFTARPVNAIFGQLKHSGAPRILFVNNISPYLDIIRDVDCDVVGVDYRVSLSQAAAALPGKSVQGNLDPTVLFGSREHVVERTLQILDNLDSHNNLIFNLGHGILPETPLESVEAMVETVHGYEREQ